MNRRSFMASGIGGAAVVMAPGVLRAQVAATPPAPRVTWQDLGNGLSYYTYFAAGLGGAVYQLGELRNDTEAAVRAPVLHGTLLDADGNIVGESYPWPVYPVIAAGGRVPMQIVVNDVHLGDWKSAQMEIYGLLDSSEAACTEALALHNIKTTKTADLLRVTGNVVNGGADPIDHITITAAGYRTDGRYAGMMSTSIQAGVPPGKSARFTLTGAAEYDLPGLSVKPASRTYTYRLLVTSLPGGAGQERC